MIETYRSAELGDRQHQEGQGQEDKQGEEAQVLPRRSDTHQSGEDEPGDEVNAEGVIELSRGGVGSDDVRGRDEDGRVRHPEGTV